MLEITGLFDFIRLSLPSIAPSVSLVSIQVTLQPMLSFPGRSPRAVSAAISYQEAPQTGHVVEKTILIEDPAELSQSPTTLLAEPRLPFGFGKCLVVNNRDWWSQADQQTIALSASLKLIAAKPSEITEITSLDQRHHRFRVLVEPDGSFKAAIWRDAPKLTAYRSHRGKFHHIASSTWRFVQLDPDQSLIFDADRQGDARTVLVFDAQVVSQVWHVTRRRPPVPDEHYVLVVAKNSREESTHGKD